MEVQASSMYIPSMQVPSGYHWVVLFILNLALMKSLNYLGEEALNSNTVVMTPILFVTC